MDLNIDDNKLIESYFNGDEQSFSILVKKYLDSVYSFAYIYVKDGSIAEDITSDVFLKVFKNIKKFDKNKKFKTWIFEITKNTALDYIKKKKDINFSSIELDNNKEDCFENLIEDEILDSFDIVNLVSRLDDEFDVKITPADLIPENFKSAQSIYNLIQQLQD